MGPEDACTPACPPACPSVFDRVVVSYLVQNGARVSYELLDSFQDPGPLTAQLQYGQTSSPRADDWADVGMPVVDQLVLHDPTPRVFGKENWGHYRVVLTTPLGTYTSDPAAASGVLSRRDWHLAREVTRQWRLAFRLGPGGQLGYLLKRRRTGQPCPRCLDPQTEAVTDPDCPDCYGTGFACGYFYPAGCVWASLSPKTSHTQVDQQRGMTNDVMVKADMLVTDLLGEEDVWVNATTDERWFVHDITHTAEIRGVPLVAKVTLRLVPFSSVIYSIPVPAQLAAWGA